MREWMLYSDSYLKTQGRGRSASSCKEDAVQQQDAADEPRLEWRLAADLGVGPTLGEDVRREATFRSSAFNTSQVRDYFINDCCFGDDVAKWMLERLRGAGVETAHEPGQEDFGWYFAFTVPGGKHCCILGYEEDAPEGMWHLWLERSRGLVGSLLGGRSQGIDDAAVRAIDDVLATAPEIRDFEWAASPKVAGGPTTR
jgi:hypothetical protein